MLVSMDTLTATLKEETKSTIKNILSEAVKDYMKKNEVIKEGWGRWRRCWIWWNLQWNRYWGRRCRGNWSWGCRSWGWNWDWCRGYRDFDAAQDGEEGRWVWRRGWRMVWVWRLQGRWDEYDFTGENDSTVVAKVFKLLNDDDQVVVKQDGDKLNIVDNEAGTEYVIELNPDSEDEFESEDDDMFEEETLMDDETLVTEEDLGYTDNYQSKDPIQGLSMTEPSKSGKSWSKGVPTGTTKPWAGKGKSDPFNKSVGKSETSLRNWP